MLSKNDIKPLRYILENIQDPHVLDSHPWTKRLFVLNANGHEPFGSQMSPGELLIQALAECFERMLPANPPRQGKRLDTRWGEYGLLAAMYFAPHKFGTPFPTSLRDAWGRIDGSIQLFVENGSSGLLSRSEIEKFKLLGNESEVAPISTLSDWHKNGLEWLAQALDERDGYLSNGSIAKVAEMPPLSAARPIQSPRHRTLFRIRRMIWIFLFLLGLALLVFMATKARRVLSLANDLRGDLSQLQQGISSPNLKKLAAFDMGLAKARRDFDLLRVEVEPWLWTGPWLRWVPVYGGDLAAGRGLIDLADQLLTSAEESYTAVHPMLTAFEGDNNPTPTQMVALLNQAGPQLLQARQAFDQAQQQRAELDLEGLSPEVRRIVEEDLDRLMPLMDDGLAAALALPDFLGAASTGPKTYLILAQNEDELRPTGGFITAAGTLVVQDGQVLSLAFADSGALDNWEKPYPLAPWQLDQYMNSRVLIFRDANWFTDFPTSALYAETLYAYHNSHSVDGVIAFDQHMLVLLLSALGPIEVEGAPYPINADNVVSYMRASKSPQPDQPLPADWNRKAFMDKITASILDRIFARGDISWVDLGEVTLQALNEHHLLLQLDDPALKEVISRHAWDGALVPGTGDFLMVVDANIGFNKTNAVVETRLSYDVDLADPLHPTGQLLVIHHNNATQDVSCIQFDTTRKLEVDYLYPIDACYYNYMRVYLPAETKLTDSSPQTVPDEWMILNRGVKGRVDVLDEEINGLKAFGTLMVVPGGESLNTGFRFNLPVAVLASETGSDQKTYRLKVRKQPGTIAVPLTIRVHLPAGAGLVSNSPDALIQGSNLLFETDLRTDLEMEVVFDAP